MSVFVGIGVSSFNPQAAMGGSLSELRLEYVCCAAFVWEVLRWLIYFRVSPSLDRLAVVTGICRV